MKAASLVGLGSGPATIQPLLWKANDETAIDVVALRCRLEEEQKIGRGVIVVYGLGEVNTGGFGGDLDGVAELCEQYGAWLHVDAGECWWLTGVAHA
jgi:glutamate/tyrosine decarboxylase-like PLP-dependent enzyme